MPGTSDRIIVAALWMVSFTSSAQFLIVAPVLPRIEEQLGVPEHLLGTLITGYAVSVGAFGLVAGPVSDRFGRRAILLLGSAVLATALCMHVLAGSYLSLLALRAAAGVGSGLLAGATVAYVGDYFPYERRGWANGWVASGLAAGQIMGVPAGAALAEGAFWLPFVLFGVVMVAATAGIALLVPAPDVRLSDRLTLSTALRTYGELLRRTDTLAAVAMFVCVFLTVSLYVTYLPTWLETTFHVSGFAVATLFLAGGVANLLTGPMAGSLSDRIGRKALIITANVGLGVVIALTTVVLFRFELAYLQFFVVMVFVAMRIAPLQSLVSSIVDADQRGALLALCFSLGQVGFAVGGTMAGVLYTGPGFALSTVIAGGFAVLAAAILWVFIPEPKVVRPSTLSGALPETSGCTAPATAKRDAWPSS